MGNLPTLNSLGVYKAYISLYRQKPVKALTLNETIISLLRAGMTVDEVEQALSVSFQEISDAVLSITPTKKPETRGAKPKHTDLTADVIMDKIRSGYSVAMITREFHCCADVVRNRMHEAGLYMEYRNIMETSEWREKHDAVISKKKAERLKEVKSISNKDGGYSI